MKFLEWLVPWAPCLVGAAFGRRSSHGSSMTNSGYRKAGLVKMNSFSHLFDCFIGGGISGKVRGPGPLDKNVEHDENQNHCVPESGGRLKMLDSTGPSMLESLTAPGGVLPAACVVHCCPHPHTLSVSSVLSFLSPLHWGSCPLTGTKHQQNPSSD